MYNLHEVVHLMGGGEIDAHAAQFAHGSLTQSNILSAFKGDDEATKGYIKYSPTIRYRCKKTKVTTLQLCLDFSN